MIFAPGTARAHVLDDPPHRRDAPAGKFRRRQHPGPGVEDLHRVGAGLQLRHQIARRGLHQDVDHAGERLRFAVRHQPRRRLVRRPLPGHHVGRDRPRRAAEAEQRDFWFFGHPEVYIIILPAFGIVSQVIPTFSRKPLFGYAAMVYATASIGFLSFIVWAHHMFTVGMPLAGEMFFMLSTMLIAIPTAVKVFNWTATMWRGSLTFETPMLFSLAFLFLFTIGGFSGLMLAIAPADFQYHDTYFVVAHFHYVLVPGALFAAIAGAYFWLPKWTGHMYDETLGKIHFWLSAIFVNVTFFPQHFLGLAGMPRRIPDYATQFADWNMVSSIGAFGFGVSQVLFAYVVVKTIRGGRAATAQVWDQPEGLEWTVPSPAPYHTFDEAPVVK